MSQFKHHDSTTNWLIRDGLGRELAGLDERQLLDIGVVRAEDGSLRLAADPTQPVIPERREAGLFARGVAWLARALRKRAAPGAADLRRPRLAFHPPEDREKRPFFGPSRRPESAPILLSKNPESARFRGSFCRSGESPLTQ